MNTALLFRALALVTFVAMSTAIIIKSELTGGARVTQAQHAVAPLARG